MRAMFNLSKFDLARAIRHEKELEEEYGRRRPMGEIWLPRKIKLLEAAGFYFDDRLACYVSKSLKKIVSAQFIDTHKAEDIEALLREPCGPTWQFYFIGTPSQSLRQDIEADLS
jgi:hypothetical protein